MDEQATVIPIAPVCSQDKCNKWSEFYVVTATGEREGAYCLKHSVDKLIALNDSENGGPIPAAPANTDL